MQWARFQQQIASRAGIAKTIKDELSNDRLKVFADFLKFGGSLAKVAQVYDKVHKTVSGTRLGYAYMKKKDLPYASDDKREQVAKRLREEKKYASEIINLKIMHIILCQSLREPRRAMLQEPISFADHSSIWDRFSEMLGRFWK